MKISFTHRLPLFAALLLATTACGEKTETTSSAAQTTDAAPTDTAENPAAVEPGHEGHDHAPGEGHGNPAEAVGPVPVGPIEPGAAVAPGGLEVPVKSHDFGDMIEGEIAEHTFDMRATGENPLIITNAKPTCGCTVGEILVADGDSFRKYNYNEPIQPGTNIQLRAKLNTKNKNNRATSKINVYCNDPRNLVTLDLAANVSTYFQVSPGSLAFGEISTQDSVEKTAFVTAKRGGSFKLRIDEENLTQGLNVELSPVNADSEGAAERWEVKVIAGPNLREGNLGVPLSLSSDQLAKGKPELPGGEPPTYGASLMLTATVRGMISYDPPYVSFGLLRPGQEVVRKLKISSFDPNFELSTDMKTRVTGPNDKTPDFKWAEHFTTEAKRLEDGKTVELQFKLTGLPDDANGSFQGRLMVETGHPDRPTISVIFSGVCRPGVRR